MLSVTVTLSQNQVEKLLGIIEECERCLVEARSILSMNASTKLAQALLSRRLRASMASSGGSRAEDQLIPVTRSHSTSPQIAMAKSPRIRHLSLTMSSRMDLSKRAHYLDYGPEMFIGKSLIQDVIYH